jgi:hypothetical protein
MSQEHFRSRRTRKQMGKLARLSVLAVLLTACAQPGSAQSVRELHRTFAVALAEPVSLQLELSEGVLQIAYSRDGQVSIAAIVQVPAGMNLGEEFLDTRLIIEEVGNRIKIRSRSHAEGPQDGIKISYRVDVPYRTEVHSFLGRGKQSFTGITGPVRAESNTGDIKASYVSNGVVAHAGSGDLDFQVIGERIEAKTGGGNIACIRAAKGVSAETGDGDISLMVVGSSTATVKHGTGRIDVGGVRGTLAASTDGGDLHVKAVPHEDWELNSARGNIRIELPPAAKFEVDATTDSGSFLINRDDIENANVDSRHFSQKANGGGKRIAIHTGSGRIVIT